MKNYIIKLSFALMACLCTFSCGEEFLEISPSDALPLDQAINSLEDLEIALNGAYAQMQNSDYYGRYFVLTPDVMSDDVIQNASANRAKEYAEYAAFAAHFITEGIWEEIYEAINRANTVINDDLEVPDAVQSDRDQIVGEAYAIRALAHFDLVRIYAQHFGFTADNSHIGVPIVTVFDQNAEPNRNTVAEVYNAVISDFNMAISLMNQDNGIGRFSEDAAKGILARVMLYMGNYAEAGRLAGEVIDGGNHALETNEGYVAAWMAGSGPDAIFEIQYDDVDNNGSDALGRMYIVEGYGDYLPSSDVLDLIPEGDARGELFKEDIENLGGEFGILRVNKFPSTIGTDNFPVVRLSEMYMIRAEARARTGDEPGAQADVDAIRKRGLPTAESVTATGQALLDEIEREKRIELMFEGHRLWELMRMQRDLVRIHCTAPESACTVSYPNDRFVLPIPQVELNANPNMSQNPGY